MDDYILMHPDIEYLKECFEKIKIILNKEYKLSINENKTKITSSKEGFIFLQYNFKVINNKTIIKLRRETVNKVRKKIKNKEKSFKKDKITFKNYYSCINNYKNTFKYDRIKINRIIG